jgi:hypothetical protein
MPLMKYFVLVGSALVLLLLAMNWLLPESTAEPVHSSIERPVIRISSTETLPERVVFDKQYAVYGTAFERYAGYATASTIGVYI